MNKFIEKPFQRIVDLSKKMYFVVAIVLVLCVITLGGIVYKQFILKKNNCSHNDFKQLILSIKKQDSDVLEKEKAFVKNNKNKYGMLIALDLVKKLYKEKKVEESLNILKNLLNFPNEKTLKTIAKLKIVSIFIQEKLYSKALDFLKKINEDEWRPLLQELQYSKTKKYENNLDNINDINYFIFLNYISHDVKKVKKEEINKKNSCQKCNKHTVFKKMLKHYVV